MKSETLLNLTLAVILVFTLTGCKKKTSEKPAEPNEAATTQNTIPERKSMAEYKAEAEIEITKKNYQQELNKLENEIEQDINQPK